METESTVARLFQRYNTYTRRPTVRDPRQRRVIFRAFERTLGAWLPRNREARILDVGCGEGALLAFLRERGYTNLAGFDLSPENVRICHELGLSFVQQFNALDVAEFGSGDYDVIFALDLLEHLPKSSAASFLDQVRARLAPRGYVVVQMPNMGSVLGLFHRYYDLSHEFGLTEKSARDLFMVAGFENAAIDVAPSWNATTPLGYLRELYLRLIHQLIFLSEGAGRPSVPTKNLLIRACRQ